MKNKINFIRLYLTKNITNYTVKLLLQKYNADLDQVILNIEKEFQYQKKELKLCSFQEAEKYLAESERKNIKILSIYDSEYPKNLLTLNTAPVVLHCKGNIKLLNNDSIAVIGSRNASLQGLSITKQITSKLSEKYTIISGLAKGIDAIAHENSIQNTIAVLGCGVEVVYPIENKKLYQSILNNNSLIISEYQNFQEPRPNFFSYRNRIISGIAKGVVVMEAGVKSGSLVTAKYALEQGRDIFAIPGHPYDIRMQGTNYLIKNGATLIQNANDVFEYYKNNFSNSLLFEDNEENIESNEESLVEVEEMILSKLSAVKIYIDDIINLLPYESSCIQKAIGQLELKNKIENSYGMICKI